MALRSIQSMQWFLWEDDLPTNWEWILMDSTARVMEEDGLLENYKEGRYEMVCWSGELYITVANVDRISILIYMYIYTSLGSNRSEIKYSSSSLRY